MRLYLRYKSRSTGTAADFTFGYLGLGTVIQTAAHRMQRLLEWYALTSQLMAVSNE